MFSKETQNAQRDAEGRRNCKRRFKDGSHEFEIRGSDTFLFFPQRLPGKCRFELFQAPGGSDGVSNPEFVMSL